MGKHRYRRRDLHDSGYIDRAIANVVAEYNRRRGQVDLPFNIGENTLVSMVENGDLQLKS